MLEILYNRRSTRKFLEKKIEEEKIKKLLTAALLAPSSKGSRPWEFIVVDDPNLLEVLAMSKPHGASLLKHAPLAIIIAGDKTKSDAWIEDCSIASIFVQLEAEALGLGSAAGYRSTVVIIMTKSLQMNIFMNTLIFRLHWKSSRW